MSVIDRATWLSLEVSSLEHAFDPLGGVKHGGEQDGSAAYALLRELVLHDGKEPHAPAFAGESVGEWRCRCPRAARPQSPSPPKNRGKA